MPKYSDYREWENYREGLVEQNRLLIKEGLPSREVPLLPKEGLSNWLNKGKRGNEDE